MLTKGTLVYLVLYPRDGPYLAVVGVPAELEVDARLLSLLQVVRLVVEENREQAIPLPLLVRDGSRWTLP